MFNRSTSTVLSSLAQSRHWIALWNIFTNAKSPIAFLKRYLSGRGEYPAMIKIAHTPAPISVMAYSWHDVLTINEIFFRKDYNIPADCRVVVDFGSNIGISALYFLTHSKCHVYAYEPAPENIPKFKCNIKPYEKRCTFNDVAVSTAKGTATFGIEQTGRYGGINIPTDQSITVTTICANDELAAIIKAHGAIDVLKIDIESLEVEILSSIDDSVLKKIRLIFLELNGELPFSKEYLTIRKSGTVYILENTLLRDAHVPIAS